MNKSGQRFFFCPMCGGRLNYKKQHGMYRLTCTSCTYIFYENPIVGVACIVIDEKGRILLGRRSRGKYKGLWCIPCGFVEYEEDVHDAAVREFKEETNLNVRLIRVYSVNSNFHDPQNHTVGVWFLAQVTGGSLQAGDDLDAVDYFDLKNLPPLAFPTDHIVINKIRKDMESGRLRLENNVLELFKG